LYSKYIKRIFDIGSSILAIIMCIPFFMIISLFVWINLGRPIIFKQLRVSKDNKIFTMYKFRTMRDIRDANGNLLPNELRQTKFGSFLRSTSIDELPELWNILKGDISFVGPRPLIPEYLPYYTEYELQRHKVRGGLIPPEVLYGDITPTWQQQFEYEIYYASHVSFLLDFKIIIASLKSVFKRNSIHYGNYNRESFFQERKSKKEKKD
jgi:undecaprenyl phosphate N,N'-diacetylbacillosamine 1-phosphate transferase